MLANIFGNTSGSPSTSAANFVPAMALGDTPTATESARLQVVPAAFTMKNFYVSLNNAPGTGKSYTFTIRKNQVDTGVTVTISDSATNAVDITHSVAFAAGDLLSIGITPSGTPTAPTLINWHFQADSGGTHFAPILGGAHATASLSTSAASYGHISGTTAATSWNATESNVLLVVPCAGTIDNLYIKSDAAPGASKSYAFEIMKNGVATGLVATVSGSGVTTANDTTHSFSVVAGDTLSIRATPTGTPTVGRYVHGFKFTPTVPGQTFFGLGSSNAPSTSATNYDQPLAQGAGYSATESSRQFLPGPCMLRAFYLAIGTAPNTGKSRTFTLRRNAVSTPITATLSNASVTGNITGQNVGFSRTDLLSLQTVPTGTPDAMTGGLHLGICAFIPVATAKTGNFFPFML